MGWWAEVLRAAVHSWRECGSPLTSQGQGGVTETDPSLEKRRVNREKTQKAGVQFTLQRASSRIALQVVDKGESGLREEV